MQQEEKLPVSAVRGISVIAERGQISVVSDPPDMPDTERVFLLELGKQIIYKKVFDVPKIFAPFPGFPVPKGKG